jgi:hypothetical protein
VFHRFAWQASWGPPIDNEESSEKLLYALLITQILEEDYADFPIFPMHSASV